MTGQGSLDLAGNLSSDVVSKKTPVGGNSKTQLSMQK